MLEPIHMEYVLNAPGPGTNRFSDLFEALDRLDSAVRDELLTRVYFAYEVFLEQRGRSKDICDQRYSAFKELFLSANATCKDEEYAVFGFVSFVLAEASRKSDIARFDRIFDGHRSMLEYVRREMVKEEMPAGEAWKEIREVMDKIEGLHKEVEESRRAYRLFCAEVVRPLIARGS